MTTTDVDIFDGGIPQKGEFKKWQTVGETVKGTYIDVREGIDGFDNPQIIYVLKDTDGKIWNVAFKKTNSIIMEKMAGAMLGQIVGFRFEELRPSKRAPGQMVKIINAYYKDGAVDHEWLAAKRERDALFGVNAQPPTPTVTAAPAAAVATPVATTAPVDEAAPSASPSAEDSQVLVAIRELALTKQLTNPTQSEAEQNAAIVAFTGLPLTADNLTSIIMKLSAPAN